MGTNDDVNSAYRHFPICDKLNKKVLYKYFSPIVVDNSLDQDRIRGTLYSLKSSNNYFVCKKNQF